MSLTVEQQQALDELVALIPPAEKDPQPGVLQTWLGISDADLRKGIDAFMQRKDAVEQRLIGWYDANPLEAMVQFMAAASWAFYQAEKGHNRKIDSFVDAVYYIATCASVGYADVFPTTHTGRAIASLVMMVGPAMTSRALDRPRR